MLYPIACRLGEDGGGAYHSGNVRCAVKEIKTSFGYALEEDRICHDILAELRFRTRGVVSNLINFVVKLLCR